MNGHERYADLAAPYVLGALDEHEGADFESHLSECPDCREEVELLETSAHALPLGVPQLEPPPELRERIMAVVSREAELLAAAGPEADRATVAAEPKAPWWRRLSITGPLAGAAVAAALVAVFVLGGGDGKGDFTTLRASQAPVGADVRMQVGESHSTLVAEGLPSPPRGRVYQIWIKRPGQDPEPTPALFRPSDAGTASVDLPGSMDGVEGVLVTHEPLGGSESPTRDPVIVVDAA